MRRHCRLFLMAGQAPLHIYEGFSLDVNQSNPRAHREMRGTSVPGDSPGSIRNVLISPSKLQLCSDACGRWFE